MFSGVNCAGLIEAEQGRSQFAPVATRFPALIAPASLKQLRRARREGFPRRFPALIAPASLKHFFSMIQIREPEDVFRR